MLPVVTIESQRPAPASGERTRGILVSIGALTVSLQTSDSAFYRILEDRYGGFLARAPHADFQFDVTIVDSSVPRPDDDLRVRRDDGVWRIERGDFSASWNCDTRRGWIRQSANPYSADTLLRIVHSVALAGKGGFLLHAASAVRNGRAFFLSGISGAGKTTLARLAPPDARVLTDEISYVAKDGTSYRAYGTPFAGELARVGENTSAPAGGLYFLEKANENRLEKMDSNAALRTLLRNILFLTQDDELVGRVFEAAAEFVSAVPACRMHFTPDARAWKMIG